MKKIILLAALTALSVPAIYADVNDDIYYDPRKPSKTTSSKQKKQSNYIANFQDQDVDTYNLRGQYYTTPVDTIGSYTQNGEDFVYTQKIQKFYNPTIVVDNADVLSDVLQNSYGNVEIVYNYGLPSFLPSYCSWYNLWPISYVGNWNWDLTWGNPWYSTTWRRNYMWGDPYYSWWAWHNPWYNPWNNPWNYPSWSWGSIWGPAWGPGWGPGGPGRPLLADYRPGGSRPTGPRPGWSSNTRPGNNHAMTRPGNQNTRPGFTLNGQRPGISHSNSRPGNTSIGTLPGNSNSTSRPGMTVNNNGHRVNGSTNIGTTVRPSGNTSTGQNSNKGGYTPSNNSSHRGGYTPANNNSNYNSTTTRSNSNSNSNHSGYTPSNNSNRGGFSGSSRGGFSGGGSSRGGFSGGGSPRGGGGHRR